MTVVALAGCAGRTPESSFYTFAPRGDVSPVLNASATIDVSRVRVAEYIDRPQMVTVHDTQVHVATSDRWAAGLPSMIQRRVIENLTAAMPGALVKDSNFGPAGDCGVAIEIVGLDGDLNDAARLDAIYVMTCGDKSRARHVTYTAPVGDDYASYATAIGQLVDKMSDDITHAAKELM